MCGQGCVLVGLDDRQLLLDELEAVMQHRLKQHVERAMLDRRSDQYLIRRQSVRPSQTVLGIGQWRSAGR